MAYLAVFVLVHVAGLHAVLVLHWRMRQVLTPSNAGACRFVDLQLDGIGLPYNLVNQNTTLQEWVGESGSVEVPLVRECVHLCVCICVCASYAQPGHPA